MEELMQFIDNVDYQKYLESSKIQQNEKININFENNNISLPIYKINSKYYLNITFATNCDIIIKIYNILYKNKIHNNKYIEYSEFIDELHDTGSLQLINNGYKTIYFNISKIYNDYLTIANDKYFYNKYILKYPEIKKIIENFNLIKPKIIEKNLDCINNISNLNDKLNCLISRIDNIEDIIEHQDNNTSDKLKIIKEENSNLTQYILKLEDKLNNLESEILNLKNLILNYN